MIFIYIVKLIIGRIKIGKKRPEIKRFLWAKEAGFAAGYRIRASASFLYIMLIHMFRHQVKAFLKLICCVIHKTSILMKRNNK